jgi:hypothetical protein
VLLVAFLALGLSGIDGRRAVRYAIGLTTVVVLAVGLGAW